ncbi:hypothetical protein ACFXI6_48295 [Streptomyces mirabilis]|uniref:hypothetical protein n=1 Tax=Streptomyces mirabilis TaxID=68239 RepID=UPI0036B41C1E
MSAMSVVAPTDGSPLGHRTRSGGDACVSRKSSRVRGTLGDEEGASGECQSGGGGRYTPY